MATDSVTVSVIDEKRILKTPAKSPHRSSVGAFGGVIIFEKDGLSGWISNTPRSLGRIIVCCEFHRNFGIESTLTLKGISLNVQCDHCVLTVDIAIVYDFDREEVREFYREFITDAEFRCQF